MVITLFLNLVVFMSYESIQYILVPPLSKWCIFPFVRTVIDDGSCLVLNDVSEFLRGSHELSTGF